MTKEYPPRFSPSTLDRAIACPGSFALEENTPRRQTGFADEGLAAHKVAEWALKDGRFNAGAYLGRTVAIKQGWGGTTKTINITVTADMCRHVQTYINAIKARMDKYKRQKNVKNVSLFIEKRLDTSAVLGVPQQSGVADIVMVVEYKNGEGLVSVEDLKYGANVKVEAKDNTQLMTYAAAAIEEYKGKLKINRAIVAIHMPRLGFVSECSLTAAKLKAFVAILRTGTQKAIEQRKLFKINGADVLTLVPGEKQCRFCHAKTLCPAFNKASGKAPAQQLQKKENDRKQSKKLRK